jgi:hypothetical protein
MEEYVSGYYVDGLEVQKYNGGGNYYNDPSNYYNDPTRNFDIDSLNEIDGDDIGNINYFSSAQWVDSRTKSPKLSTTKKY